MRTSTLTVALVSALLVVSAGTAGALTTGPLQPQASPAGTDTGTTGTDVGTSTGTATAPSGGGPAITFDDQNSTGETVLVESATLPQNGFVVIYDSTRSGNEVNQIIGASYLLNAGTSDNIRIQLDQPLNQSKSLKAVLHVDSNGNGQFDYVASNGQQDPPLMQGDSRIVDIAQVTVESATGGESPTASGQATDASGDDGGDASTQAPSGGADGGNATTGGNQGGGGDGSGAFGPGFGLVAAVVALLAAALLAVRRN